MGKHNAKEPARKPWDRRPWPSKGDIERDTTHAAVGRALSNWERLEAFLAELFASLVSARDGAAAKRAYVAVRTFEGRAEMMRAASTVFFHNFDDHDLMVKYKEILSRSTSLAPRRNDIAHAIVSHFWTKSSDGELKTDYTEYALYPSLASYKERELDGTPSYCMTSKEIEFFSDQFIELANQTRPVAHQVGVKHLSREASRIAQERGSV